MRLELFPGANQEYFGIPASILAQLKGFAKLEISDHIVFIFGIMDFKDQLFKNRFSQAKWETQGSNSLKLPIL